MRLNTHRTHFIAPLQAVVLALLDVVVDLDELVNAELSHQFGVLLGLGPSQWFALRKQTHSGGWCELGRT